MQGIISTVFGNALPSEWGKEVEIREGSTEAFDTGVVLAIFGILERLVGTKVLR